jgi:ribosomal-protein-alanine N-acetyltransferase
MTNETGSNHYKQNPPLVAMAIGPLQPEHASEICGWTYAAPYDLYNWPTWEAMQKDGIEFGDPVLRDAQYAAVLGENRQLIGFAQFFPLAGVTRLGLGLRPDLCGQGLGVQLACLVAMEARRRSPDNEIDLEVLTWNKRAIRAYEKAGFRITDTYARRTPSGYADFFCMVHEPSEF